MVGDTPEHWNLRVVHVTLDPSLALLGAHAIDDVRAAFGAWLTGVIADRTMICGVLHVRRRCR